MNTHIYTQIGKWKYSIKKPMLIVSKMVSVHTVDYGFKEQIPKVSIFRNMKIYEKGSRVFIFHFY